MSVFKGLQIDSFELKLSQKAYHEHYGESGPEWGQTPFSLWHAGWLAAMAADRENSSLERHTCPSRGAYDPNIDEGLDVWDTRGEDRVCSFCGSIHPDDLKAILEELPENEEVTVEISTKRHKLYINRPNIKNASEGAIKYYFYHGVNEEMEALLNQCIPISRERAQAKMRANRDKLIELGMIEDKE